MKQLKLELFHFFEWLKSLFCTCTQEKYCTNCDYNNYVLRYPKIDGIVTSETDPKRIIEKKYNHEMILLHGDATNERDYYHALPIIKLRYLIVSDKDTINKKEFLKLDISKKI